MSLMKIFGGLVGKNSCREMTDRKNTEAMTDWEKEEIKQRDRHKEHVNISNHKIKMLWENFKYENSKVDKQIRLRVSENELLRDTFWKFKYSSYGDHISMDFGFKSKDNDVVKILYCVETDKYYFYYKEYISSKTRSGYFEEIDHYYYLEDEDVRKIIKACILMEDPLSKGILREIPHSEYNDFSHRK